MKKLLFILVTVSLMLTCTFAGEKKSKWERFSDNMKLALNKENPGVTLAALKLIIRFSDKLTDSEHFSNVANVFIKSDNLEIRKTALIALYKLDPEKAVEFFSAHKALEENKDILKKMAAIITAYKKDAALADSEVENSFEICRCCNFVSLTY